LVCYDSPERPVARLFYNHLIMWFWIKDLS
jgi:hypothetical protein